MKGLFTFIVLVAVAIIQQASAQYLQFVENKGQWDKSIRFKTDFQGGALILKPSGYKVVLHNKDQLKALAGYYSGHFDSSSEKKLIKDMRKLVVHSHAYEINFLNADSSAIAEPDKPLSVYNNYFIGNDSSKWRTGCKVFNGITYKNVYKNVDIRYYSDNGNLKYDIIIKPGADVSRLALQFNGLDGLSLNKYGNLTLKTSVGDVYQTIPSSYQVVNNVRSKVKAAFQLDGNTVHFKVDKYDKTNTLVIDPTEIFSTFVGSISDDWGYTATYDNDGNFYAGGIVFADGFDSKNVGGYDETFNGGDESEGSTVACDISLIKFNSTGNLALYATYLGGKGDEVPCSMVVDNNGNLIVLGRTSSADYPVTVPGFGTGGSFDIILSKFSSDGKTLMASRKFGGTGSDGVNIQPKYVSEGMLSLRRNYGDDARSEVIIDNSNNICLASSTRSSDFPVTANASKKRLTGDQDGVFLKVSSDLTTVYTSTLLGGNGDDAAFVLDISRTTGNIYVAGGTTSTDLAFNAVNAPEGIVHNTYQGGACDGFIAELSSSNNALIKVCYVGTGGNDMVYGMKTDKYGYPYAMGTTTTSFPVYKSAFNANNNQANGKQFITKLNPDLTDVIYNANFGKGINIPDISPTAFLVDVCGNVYVSGWGGRPNDPYYPGQNTFGLSTTANALPKQPDGNDFYFFVLEKNANSQLYGSFFGNQDTPTSFGDHVDGGTSRFDSRGVIYQAVCANCGKNGSFPTGPTGVWSGGNPAQTGAECNEAAVKIAFELSGVIASIRTSINSVLHDTTGCIPLTVDFEDTIALGKKYIWDFGDGTQVITTTPATSHVYNTLGNYKVSLVSIDSSLCNIADTAYINIRARNNPAHIGLTVTKLLPCQSFNYQFNNISTPYTGYTFQPGDFTWGFGDGTKTTTNATSLTHQYLSSGVYNVKLYFTDTAFCNSPDSVTTQLRVASVLKAQFTTPSNGCAPYRAVFDNTSLGGQNFVWDFGDGTTSTEAYPIHLYQNPGTYTVKLSATDNLTCNPQSDTSIVIAVHESPTTSFTYSPTIPKENTPYVFTNTSIGANNYKWNFGDGDTLNIPNQLPVTHIYNASNTYSVCLIAYNQFGCSDTLCQQIKTIVTPLVDVPNAFSPNGDGTNDVIYVKGYGIDKMTWNIYNRWGQLLFSSYNLNTGWDGRFKNALQSQDVYAYILNVEFTDGTKVQKKGDITLLR